MRRPGITYYESTTRLSYLVALAGYSPELSVFKTELKLCRNFT